jgi:hypothetical protein
LGPLVAYDLKLLGKAIRAALSRKHDLLFVLLAAPILLLWAVHGAGELDPPPLARALLAALAAFGANLVIRDRCDRLKEHSIVARHALQRGEALRYVLCWNLIAAVASVGLVATPAPDSLGRLLIAYSAGTGGAFLYRPAQRRLSRWLARRRDAAAAVRNSGPAGATRRRRIAALVAGRSGFRKASLIANILLFAAVGAAIALLYLGLRGRFAPPGAVIAAAVPALAVFAVLQRQHAALLRYLLFLGVTPTGPAVVPVAMAAASVAGALVVGIAVGGEPWGLLLGGGAAILLFGAVALPRAHHYATRSRQVAEIWVQIDLLAFVVVAFSLPPLAPFVIAARLLFLGRRADAMRYLAW